MLTIEDCIGLSTLTPEEVDAIADHEHCSEIIAVELGSYLLQSPDGVPRIRKMILDDIETAARAGNHRRSAELKLVLKHFTECHGCP